MTIRLVITGSRNGHPCLESVLDAAIEQEGPPELVILGDARGVDSQARKWAIARGFPHVVKLADWSKLGKRAGHLRNAAMVADARPGDLCIAFPDKDSIGTWDCVRKAHAAGLHVSVCALPGRDLP